MNPFDQLPRSVKKTIRFIKQDVDSLEKLEAIEKVILKNISERKFELKGSKQN